MKSVWLAEPGAKWMYKKEEGGGEVAKSAEAETQPQQRPPFAAEMKKRKIRFGIVA